MKIYTKTGDDGTTSLSGGRRIPKQHIRIEAYGTVDELISWIGLLAGESEDEADALALVRIQGDLMSSAAALAHDSSNKNSRLVLPDPHCIEFLEKSIDRMQERLPVLNSFILPGGTSLSSHCHIARCVCRRAERAVLRLNEIEKTPETVRLMLNRLSDFLFVLARKVLYDAGKEDIKWSV